MLSIKTSTEVQRELAAALRQVRRQRRHSRAVAAAHSGVPVATIRRFETTGEISLRQFLMLCEAYGSLHRAAGLIEVPPARTMDELIALEAAKERKAARAGGWR